LAILRRRDLGSGTVPLAACGTAALLDVFEAFDPGEKRVLTAGVLRHAIPFDSGPLDDEEPLNVADQLFAAFDDDENHAVAR
jgi:hypothetical protein